MDTSTWQIISVAVTRHPTAVWLENVLRSALMDIKDCPKFIVSDRDGIYGEWLGTFLKDCYDITLYRTPPGMPLVAAEHRLITGRPLAAVRAGRGRLP